MLNRALPLALSLINPIQNDLQYLILKAPKLLVLSTHVMLVLNNNKMPRFKTKELGDKWAVSKINSMFSSLKSFW
jgi:hypothetical protein